MDVVATEVKKLGGGLFIESTPGKGARFTIRLPFTLAITQALMVRVHDEFYALPVAPVEGVARLPKSEIERHLAAEQPTFEYLETHLDDMNPEWYEPLMAGLFAAGALDVIWSPIHMKKNRPGTLLQVLCRTDLLEAIVDCILTETTTLGFRHYEAGRYLLSRSVETIETSFGKVAVKRVCSPRGQIRRVPEYEECRRIALEQNLPIRVVYDRIAGEANPSK